MRERDQGCETARKHCKTVNHSYRISHVLQIQQHVNIHNNQKVSWASQLYQTIRLHHVEIEKSQLFKKMYIAFNLLKNFSKEKK